MTQCKNCQSEVTQQYCPNCGQPASLKRIDGHYIVHEIEHLLHFEKGLLYTIRELVKNPGQTVRRFISEDRSRLVKPVMFIIITSLIYTLVNHYFHLEDGYVNYETSVPNTTGQIFKWIQDHYGYSNMLMGLFIALWVKFFFRKSAYNFYEILILLCFVMGVGMLIFALFALLEQLTHTKLMQVASIIGFVYIAWAIGQFFGKARAINFVKAFAAYILGMITFSLAAILLGTFIDMLK
ncbi:MAG: DUF3667 domain-containing protein [Saprospiraceae bacterium]|nr:DUF3667 domain-containing protein [Saprospiraceae bacterium]